MRYKQAICSGLLGELRTRFVLFQPARTLEQRFELASRIKDLDGLEIGYPGDFEDRKKLRELLSRYGFEVAGVNLKVRGPDFMSKGSFSSPNRKAFDTAVTWGKEAMDAAAEVGCNLVTSCPLNDGFDYPFEMDYLYAWEQLVDGIRQVARHRTEVKLAIEYKLTDPRTRSLVSNVGETLVLARQTGCPNVGVNLDFGHALIARENPSQSAALAAAESRLFYVHLNDNDRIADVDLITGMVHFWETLEFFYYLPRLGYKGWMVSDVVPRDIDPAQVFTKTIEIHRQFINLAETVDGFELADLMRERDLMGVHAKLKHLIGNVSS